MTDQTIYKIIIKLDSDSNYLYYTCSDFKESGNHIQFKDKFGKNYEFHKDCLIRKEWELRE